MTTPSHVLAIDAGGSAVKATVVGTADGAIAALARRPYAVSHPGPGLAEFDPEAWWTAIAGCIADAAAAAPARIGAVVCTGMRIPFVLIDADGGEIGPGILNHDRRGADQLARVRAVGGPGLYRRTGHWPAPEFGIGKLAWLAAHEPDRLGRARHLLQFHDWLVFRLCGAIASEPSSAAMSGMLDLVVGEWATDLIAGVGVDPSLFPPLVRSGTPLGGVREDVAAATGVPPGTPVLAGGGDTHMSCLGVGAAEPGDVCVVAGSTTPVMLAAAAPLVDAADQPVVSPHVFPGRFAIETNAGATGIRFTWLRALAAEMAGRDYAYAELDAAAAAAEVGAGGLFVTAGNPGWGERAWAATPPAAIIGLHSTHTVGELARATLEASAVATAAQVDRLERVLGSPIGRIRATGGATRSAFYGQLLADAAGRPVEVARVAEPSARAAALVAACDPAALPPPLLEVHEPGPAAVAAYRDVRRAYEVRFAGLEALAT
jgi:sugar (pentulose or hexulose) kinase